MPDYDVTFIEMKLEQLMNNKAIQYYLPSNPIGERFVIGYKDQVLNFSIDEIIAFLVGADVVAVHLAERVGLRMEK